MVTLCIAVRPARLPAHEWKWGMTMIPGPKMVDHCVNIYRKIDSGVIFAGPPVPILLYKIFWTML
jgi:hypothetical protein